MSKTMIRTITGPRMTACALAAASLGLAIAGTAVAQTETPAQARARAATQALNGGPADSVLRPGQTTAGAPLSESERRPALPPPPVSVPALSPAARAAVAPTRPARTLQTAPDDAATRLLNGALPSATADRTTGPTATPSRTGDAPPPTSTPLIRGYYVRGDMNCDQVWPGEGDLAWLSDTSFTLDFGGCEPGSIQEVGPAAWREDQRCVTELGGDGGVYEIAYEQVAPDAIVRRARLSLDGSVEEDRWTLCQAQDVPEEARFHDRTTSPSAG